MVNLKSIVIFWIVITHIIWIALSVILTAFAVIPISFEDLVILNLTNTATIGLSLVFGSITALGFYSMQYIRSQRADNLT